MLDDGAGGGGTLARVDAACLRMADAQADLKVACDAFEVAAADPANSTALLLRACQTTRAAGMRCLGLTTEYLTALAEFAHALPDPNPGASSARTS